MLGKILLLLGILLMVMSGLTASGCMGRATKPTGWSGVVIADGNLFLGSTEGKLIALNTSGGSHLWEVTMETPRPSSIFGCAQSPTPVAIYGTPVVAGDLVYVGGYNGKVYAFRFDKNGAKEEWVYPDKGNLEEPIVGGLIISQGKVYFGCSDGKVYALDAAKGYKVWDSPFQTGDKIWSTPAIDGDTLFIGSFDKKLYALNATDGSKKWEFETEGAIISTPVIYDNTIYIGSLDRHIYAINATVGSLRWKSLIADKWFWTQPAVYNNIVYAPCLNGKVYILDAAGGQEVVSAVDLGSPVSSSPVLVDSSIIIASENGQVWAIDTGNNEKRLLVDLEATTYAPLYANDGIVYIHTQKKENLYALNAQAGKMLWSLQLSSE